MNTLFVIDHVDICINSSKILKDITFEIYEGEFLGIIGPNGSGKSTLIRALTGVLKPSRGSIRLRGREVSEIPRKELARTIAVVPQDIPIAFDYSVMEVVLMGRSPYMKRFEIESDKDLKIAADALVRSNLLELAERNVGALSGGERQRVMVARALAQESEIIFLDEPTAHLDINYQVEVLHLIKREINEKGKTGVVVLHDLNLASEFCDRLLMLKDGRIFASGPPEEVITPENVRNVYETHVLVRKHPTSGRPYVLSVGSPAIASRIGSQMDDDVPRVHVICGGGSGSPLFVRLLDIGCEVTAGVVNIGDTDQETAEALGIDYVEEAPYSAISEAANSANLRYIDRADAVIIAEVPFGTGNLANLRAALYAIEHKKPVAIIGDLDRLGERDFTDGEATKLFIELINKGARVISLEEVDRWVENIRVA